MKKIVLIGAYPPPVGGVSIHIQRLIGLLSNHADFDVVDESSIRKERWPFNLRSFNLLKYLKIVKRADVVHVHSGLFIRRLFHVIVCRFLLRKFVVVTVHHDPAVERFSGVTKWLLSKCNHAILVNREGYDMMKTNSGCQYHMMPAFLPPIIDREPDLPETVKNWTAVKKGNGAVICVSNAWRLVLHDNEDLYGLDLCMEAFRLLKLKGRNYKLVFVVASNPNQVELMNSYKKYIHDNGLEEDILIWESPLSFIRLILDSDIVLRTTNTDGDALSIREAIHFRKPVIASDVVKRPDGVRLFQNRNVESLVENILNCPVEKANGKKKETKDYISQYKAIYGL